MILHRFCSKKEFEAYQRGDMLINNTDHRVKRGNATSSVGFCFFVEDPEEAKHWLSGIVDFDYCITVEVDESDVRKSWGRYADSKLEKAMIKEEYCSKSYDNYRFRLLDATTKYSTYAPNHSLLKQMLPELFI